MTENEAIKSINDKYETFFALSTTNDFDMAMATAIKALEEIQAYRAIGTVEEFKAYKLGDCMNDCEHYDNCSNYIYSKGYNKAIDDFAEKLCTDVESFTAEVNGMKADLLTLDYLSEFVFEIAQQLKGEKQ